MKHLIIGIIVLLSSTFSFAHGAHENREDIGWAGYFAPGNPSYFESDSEGNNIWLREIGLDEMGLWGLVVDRYMLHFHVRNSGQEGVGTLLQPSYRLSGEEYQQLLNSLNESSVDMEAYWNENQPDEYWD